MLYVTTRNNQETYTAHRALTENRGPDGGFYVPLRLPQLDQVQIEALEKKPFNHCVAEILNLLLGTKVTGYDIDFTIGRSPAHLVGLAQRVYLGQSWHNLNWKFSYMEKALFENITQRTDLQPTDWFSTALRIAVFFGYFGKLMRKGMAGLNNPIDIAVLSGDFSAPMAAWYARSMGLPVANIILCCNENNNPWELIHHGEMRTNVVALSTMTPQGDYVIPTDLERFVHACGGSCEVERFVEACRMGRMYIPGDAVYEKMQLGMQAAVVGQSRVHFAIPNGYRTHGQVFDPCTALVYSGLLDYRAATGESRTALILSETGPIIHAPVIAEAMGIPVESLYKILNIT